jgi:antitoxin YefM
MTTDITIQDVYKELQQIRKEMVRREDLDALMDTIELMNNPEKMELIKKSHEDIRKGRVKEFTSIEDLLSRSKA